MNKREVITKVMSEVEFMLRGIDPEVINKIITREDLNEPVDVMSMSVSMAAEILSLFMTMMRTGSNDMVKKVRGGDIQEALSRMGITDPKVLRMAEEKPMFKQSCGVCEVSDSILVLLVSVMMFRVMNDHCHSDTDRPEEYLVEDASSPMDPYLKAQLLGILDDLEE